MSSTCFEPEGSSSGRRLYMQLWYDTFCMHQYKQATYLLPTRLLILMHVNPLAPEFTFKF